MARQVSITVNVQTRLLRLQVLAVRAFATLTRRRYQVEVWSEGKFNRRGTLVVTPRLIIRREA